jgi:hypothetical protein
VMAYDANVDGTIVRVVAVVLNQFSLKPHPAIALNANVAAAGRAALVLSSAAAHHLSPWHLTARDVAIGAIGWPSSTVPVVPSTTIVVPTFDGVPAAATVVDVPWGSDQIVTGQVVAVISVTSGAYRGQSQIAAVASLTRPSLWQRLR